MAALPGNTPTRTVSNKSRLLIAMVVMATLGASCGCRTASVPTNQTLRSGSTGPAVKAMQTRLSQLGFFVAPDGEYGFNTSHAVMAFQKFYGLGRDSVAGPATLNHINLVGRPDARSRSGRVIEVDLARQVVLLVDGGYVHHVFNASTGDSSHRTPRAASGSSARSTAFASPRWASCGGPSTSTAASHCMVRRPCPPIPPATGACA